MEFEPNAIMAKLTGLDDPPVIVSGYIGEVNTTSLALHERLDAKSYLLIPREGIVHSISAQSAEMGERVTLFIHPSAKICLVKKRCVEACRLHEAKLCDCGRRPEGPGSGVSHNIEERIDQVIRAARLLLSWGITELDCSRIDTVSAGCCKELNKLLDEINEGGEGTALAEGLVRVCNF